jgi:hypothetical protein
MHMMSSCTSTDVQCCNLFLEEVLRFSEKGLILYPQQLLVAEVSASDCGRPTRMCVYVVCAAVTGVTINQQDYCRTEDPQRREIR